MLFSCALSFLYWFFCHVSQALLIFWPLKPTLWDAFPWCFILYTTACLELSRIPRQQTTLSKYSKSKASACNINAGDILPSVAYNSTITILVNLHSLCAFPWQVCEEALERSCENPAPQAFQVSNSSPSQVYPLQHKITFHMQPAGAEEPGWCPGGQQWLWGGSPKGSLCTRALQRHCGRWPHGSWWAFGSFCYTAGIREHAGELSSCSFSSIQNKPKDYRAFWLPVCVQAEHEWAVCMCR